MERQVLFTADDSHTLFVPALNETYHSMRGAVSESLHVFIDAGLKYFVNQKQEGEERSLLRILEVGFGTGLNALLTLCYAEENKLQVYYEGLEKYPLTMEEVALLNYPGHERLLQLHETGWEKPVALSPYFSLCKRKVDLLDCPLGGPFDLVYFDAFAPTVQPELWSETIFINLRNAMQSGGVLVTYSSKGTVKKALRAAGFDLKRLQGAAGKHHMLRASLTNCGK